MSTDFFNVGTRLGALFIIINNSDTFFDSEHWDSSQIGIDLELPMAEETIDCTNRRSRPIQILTRTHYYLSVSVPIFSWVNDLSHSTDRYLVKNSNKCYRHFLFPTPIFEPRTSQTEVDAPNHWAMPTP
jgi:hypothetical protein